MSDPAKSILSEISITPIRPQRSHIAWCSLVYRREWFLGDIALHVTKDGNDFRLSYPAKTLFNGAVINTFYPISKEIGDLVKSAIVEEYLALLEKTR